MKKIFIFTLSAIFVLSVTACGGSSSDNSSSATTAAAAEAVTETTAEETAAAEETASPNEIVFEGMTVVDNDECSIVISALETGGIFGDSLPVSLENKSDEITYMFSLQSLSIDDLEISNMFAKEVAPGKKANGDIDIMDSSLKTAGITDYSDIELTFKVYDSNDWLADPAALETVHVYLYGEDKASSYVREPQSTDNVLVDDDNVTVIVTGYDPDSLLGYAVDLYLVNKTDTEVMFSVNDASINGYMIDPFYATSLSSGKSKYSSVNWSKSKLEENGIEQIDEIEFTLKARDSSSILADPYVNETITLNP